MSAWLSSFSLPNPFKSDSDSDDGAGDDQDVKPTTGHHSPAPASPNSTPSPTSGVKQDLSSLSQTFSHHLRGVASFLAPPPASQQLSSNEVSMYSSTAADGDSGTASSSNSETITAIKRDLVEIGGSFKSLLSSSSNKAVSGISKFASNILQFEDDVIDEGEDDQEEEEEEDIAGINEEVLDFVHKVSLRPELWTDFPLSLPIVFDMSDNQRAHAEAIEQLVPGLVTLRQTCSDLSDEQFWMIYFILLLPRLNEIDMELLSTSEIIEVRETLLQKLQNKRSTQVETSANSETVNTSAVGLEINASQGEERLSEQKDTAAGSVNATGEREVETGKTERKPEDKHTGQGKSLNSKKHSENEDDVSFSDLEDDDNDLSDRVSGFRSTHSARGSSASESNEWVRLTENSGVQGGQNKSGLSTVRGKDSEGEESSDWLTVDDIDLDSLTAA